MQALQGLQQPGCGIPCCSGATRLGPSLPQRLAAPRSSIIRSRQQAVVTTANFNPFKNFGKGSEDDARKALEKSMGKKSGLGAYWDKNKDKPRPKEPTPATGGGGGGFAGLFGGAGGGGDGGEWKWGGEGDDDGPKQPEKPIWQELKELFIGMWVVWWNMAAFLLIANILHRTLDWCCQVELLLLVGAPTQAFERVASRFYSMIEWIERNMLGWDVPESDDTLPMYENIALFYPEEHAYTYDAYRYPMNEAEKRTLKYYYALRWWERDGGFKGDVKFEEVQRILDRYQPDEVDLRKFQQAAREGRLDEYWASHADQLERLTGSREPPKIGVGPIGTLPMKARAPAATAAAPATAATAAVAQNA